MGGYNVLLQFYLFFSGKFVRIRALAFCLFRPFCFQSVFRQFFSLDYFSFSSLPERKSVFLCENFSIVWILSVKSLVQQETGESNQAFPIDGTVRVEYVAVLNSYAVREFWFILLILPPLVFLHLGLVVLSYVRFHRVLYNGMTSNV